MAYEYRPLILFGAFDRHNFGDILLGEVARAVLAPCPVVFAGLAERDLSVHGGRKVRAISALAREAGCYPATIIHVGGEILTCSLYEAAVMLQSDAAAAAAIARFDTDPLAAQRWAMAETGLAQPIAYVVPRELFAGACFVGFLGVGGVEFGALPEAAQASVIARLRQADFVWVRDRQTCSHLACHGVLPRLAPDPAELTAILFRAVIRAHARAGEPANVRQRFGDGYLAVQFNADFGDDATLRILGAQLRRLQAKLGCGVVLFRAGGAPWHDRSDVYRRLLNVAPGLAASVFESLHVWDIAALLSRCAGFIGSSLHGRIVAEAFARPAVSLVRAGKGSGAVGTKVGAYVHTWNPEAAESVVSPEWLAAAYMDRAKVGGRRLRLAAHEGAGRVAQAIAAVKACLPARP
ncbi:polysaccharide pyruvyl transferase family protein [Propionivibrio limicola]|uniref:polysaccharide pyruvyl transferase family protein n=1 Tax=Propionivibrio limicola TaxID=167645 RepID=UPI0012927B78|nr:polysaccharide pyruvyl transferase family protein [Propionivibrio limicola]